MQLQHEQVIEKVEVVIYDPHVFETYPSICTTADQVRDRFDFVGGEVLIFDQHGNYLGQVVKEIGS